MRCKPGDLAIVLRSSTAPDIIGAVVEVLRCDHSRVSPRAPGVAYASCFVRFPRHRRWTSSGNLNNVGWLPDANLKPLPPSVLVDEDQHQTELMT